MGWVDGFYTCAGGRGVLMMTHAIYIFCVGDQSPHVSIYAGAGRYDAGGGGFTGQTAFYKECIVPAENTVILI